LTRIARSHYWGESSFKTVLETENGDQSQKVGAEQLDVDENSSSSKSICHIFTIAITLNNHPLNDLNRHFQGLSS
jgi:hypothetical protein